MQPSATRITETFRYGAHDVTIETGALARQATGAALVTVADTVVLATVVARREPAPGKSFLPLTVNYQERYYAGGRIPGGFFKREGRPAERETLISRLIDRPIRPLFPEHFRNETQVIATVLSLDPEVGTEIPAMLACSAALRLAGIPFNGPIGAARIGYASGQYVLNPSKTELETSELELVVAGTARAVLMVESEARLLAESVMLGAVAFGHQQMQIAIDAIEALAAKAGVTPFEWSPPKRDPQLAERAAEIVGDQISTAYAITDRTERRQALEAVRVLLLIALPEEIAADRWTTVAIEQVFDELKYRAMRSQVLQHQRRVDGRKLDQVRPIECSIGCLPRTHGSAIFTRGETQALVTVTLGTKRDAQLIDSMEGTTRDPFLLHYNFPPYCVGETGMMIGPKRREIGHGKLAKRGIQAVMPDLDSFPYVIRIVSEITESNGSSSMASVCGASMALMDAGVPITAPVAGVAMGLVKEGEDYAVLTDILGDEDHLGDMDFKVAGTADGVTALQMDIKIDGITEEIMEVALERARLGRLHILGEMAKSIDAPRAELSVRAPRLYTLKIAADRIRDVIGKGGATIRSLVEQTGTEIDVTDDGTVTVAATTASAAEDALARIRLITADVEPGATYEGPVARIMDFGAFVTILPGRDGLVHISQISTERVERVSDKLSEGDIVKVKVLEIDRQGRIRLSMRAVEEEPGAVEEKPVSPAA
ncbi:MAG: polyribonucleotide nucleotidyltransferase [Woeseia sp.]